MTIKAKILLLVAAFAVMATAITALGLITIRDYNRVIDDYTLASGSAFRAERLNLLVADATIELRNIYISKTPTETEQRIAALNGRLWAMKTLMTRWREELKPGDVPEFDELVKGTDALAGFSNYIEKMAREQGPAAAATIGLKPELIAGRERYQARLDSIVNVVQSRMQARRDEVRVFQSQRTREFLLIAGAGIIALLLASLWIAIHSIADPLKRVTQSIIRLSQGAYDTAIPATDGADEISRLWTALGILKNHAIEAKRLNEQKLELHLD